MNVVLFSSWLPQITLENRIKTQEFCGVLTKYHATLLTGGCTGISAAAVETYSKQGGATVGFFPVEHQEIFVETQSESNHYFDGYTERRYVKGYSARSIAMIDHADCAVIINGRVGTLSEATMAIEEGLPLLVITNTGGIADELQNILLKLGKNISELPIVFSESIEDGFKELQKHIKKT